MNARAALGNQAMGYWRGEQFQFPGSGSGMGASQAGAGVLTQGQGFNALGQTWHPTVLYMIALVIVEMIVFGYIGKMLR